MKLQLLKGSTSVAVNVLILDSTSTVGAGKTGLAFNTASLIGYYARQKAAATAITLATQTVTGAYSSGGFVEIDATNMKGLYRLDIPDAALATGVDFVDIMLSGATGMVPVTLEIQLTDDILTQAKTESYRANGAAGSVTQLLYEILALETEKAVAGTTVTAKKLDHSTTAATYTLDSGTTPTSITRAT